ncbi:MAG: hypothetical protein Q9220_003841 [cf. Caloplaca sp. 1 TL-2023]
MGAYYDSPYYDVADDLDRRRTGCIHYDPDVRPPIYGYDPNLAAGVILTIAFFLSMVWHTVEVSRSREWWYAGFAAGAFAPCFFSASIYYILSALVDKYGLRYSPLRPRSYLYIFITFDIISILMQSIGGGLAAAVVANDIYGDPYLGTWIMEAGIIVQLLSMTIFGGFWVLFLWRARREMLPVGLVTATSVASVLIVVRNLYRVVELSQGWEGHLITHEIYFACLDGELMICVAMVFNLWFPARWLRAKERGQGIEGGIGLRRVVWDERKVEQREVNEESTQETRLV